MNTHFAQWFVVALVVAGSASYATWTLLPAALRRGLATALLTLPLPSPIAARMRAAATSASSCGCSGCDRNPLPGTASERATTGVVAQPIRLHRRLPS